MQALSQSQPNFWSKNPYLWAALVIVALLAIPFCTRAHSEWDSVYVRAAQELLAGRDVYHAQFGYTYPPFQMTLALPVAQLDRLPRRLGFFALNVACWIWLVSSAWAISGGKPIRAASTWSLREHAVFLLGLGCGIWYSFHALAHQQTDIIVAGFVVGGCRWVQTGRTWRGGAAIGLAAAMKCTPLLFAPYLLFRRRYIAAALVVVVAVGASLFPDLVSRCPNDATWLTEWYALFLKPMSNPNYPPGMWASDVLYNQSVSGTINRWFSTEWSWSDSGVAVVTRASDPARLRLLILGVEFGLAAAVALLFCRRLRLTPEAIVSDARRAGCEYAIVVVLMVLYSPMSSIPHFCTLILPGFFLARIAIERRDRVAQCAVAAAIVLAALSNKDLQGSRLYTLTLWHGLVMANAAVLLAGLCWVLWRMPRHVATSLALRASRAAIARPELGQIAVPLAACPPVRADGDFTRESLADMPPVAQL